MPINNNFNHIPIELRELKQWVLWKYVEVEDGSKPTKVPYSTFGTPASVTSANDWSSFDSVVSSFHKGGYSGIGFVFTEFDPYAFIDLDATEEHSVSQLKIFQEFDSYSERSPSGKGLHIIIKGAIPHGRKRSDVEIYSSKRYATMTGDIFKQAPIAERHDLLNQLYEQMGGPPITYSASNANESQTQSDEEIIRQASNAANGYKFTKLYEGEWHEFYPNIAASGQGSSEACFGLVDIIAFYTQNRAQIERIFLKSKIGNVKKYIDRRDLVHKMIQRSFDRLPPKMDFDGYRIQLEGAIENEQFTNSNSATSNNNVGDDIKSASPHNQQNGQIELPLDKDVSPSQVRPAAHNSVIVGSNPTTSTIIPPPGLVGEIAQFIYQAAPRPVPEIAIAGAIGLMAGICGRAYNISGTGLNQYILCLAMTGAGKEAMASGIDKIINAVQLSVPVASEFIGPSEIASGQALIKYLANKSQSFVSVLGEFGLRLRSMSSERANSAEIALRRMLLDLYNKSGYGQVSRPSIYADSEKNTNIIISPAFSILGESTPERFYDILNEEMISEGLLPRFMLIEYSGSRPALNENAIHAQPPDWLIAKIATLMANVKTTMANRKVIDVKSSNEADAMMKAFDKLSDKKINATDKEIVRQLWNRAHIKMLKIAALLAVGTHPFDPIIQVDQVEWAQNIVENDIRTLSEKFEKGSIGKSSDEIKQVECMIRMMKEYVTGEWSKIKKYSDSEMLFNARIIPHSYLMRRLAAMTAFKNDRNGSTLAIKRTVQNLVESDFIREVSKKDLIDKFRTTQKSFMITNMKLIGESN